MTKPIPSGTIEYERYVDGLRKANKALVQAAQFATETFEHSGCAKDVCPICDLKAAIATAKGVSTRKTITIHIERGLVQEVTGVPAGYELRIEDYDIQNPGDDSWDAEKECVVTAYGGDGV